MSADTPLLHVQALKKHYPITEGLLRREVGRVRAVDGIDFTLDGGETLGLVGESGCGKSTAATTLLRLEEPTGGEIVFDDENVDEYDTSELKRFRRRAQMIFQDPNSSFDPRMSIGESVAEPLRVHGLPADRRRAVVENLLDRIGLSAEDYDRYPHEFSGGQKQRIALARALVVNPDLIVADEPVSALDVSIQADILSLLNSVQAEFDLAVLFISHDMGVIREVCDRVAVMYLGEIVEIGPVEAIFENPQHPYTRALLASIPNPDPRQRGTGAELTGDVPSPENPPAGCRFHTRCPEVIQPDGYTFEQENWRSVMNLRSRLAAGHVDPDAIREIIVAESDEESDASIEQVTDAQLRAGIREEYGIPESLEDSDSEAVLSDALDSIVASDIDSATELLATEFDTVCEQRNPALQATDAEHPAACHLHDQEQEHDRSKSSEAAELYEMED